MPESRSSPDLEPSENIFIDSHVHLWPESIYSMMPWIRGTSLDTEYSVADYLSATPRCHLPYHHRKVFGVILVESNLANVEHDWTPRLEEVDRMASILHGQPNQGTPEYDEQPGDGELQDDTDPRDDEYSGGDEEPETGEEPDDQEQPGDEEEHARLSEERNLPLAIIPWAPVTEGVAKMEEYRRKILDRLDPLDSFLKGMRYVLQDQPEGTMLKEDFIAGLKWLGWEQLTFDLAITTEHLGTLNIPWRMLGAVRMIMIAHGNVEDSKKVVIVIGMCPQSLLNLKSS